MADSGIMYASKQILTKKSSDTNFLLLFFDFFKDFVYDEQTFLEVKQHPQVGPEATHTICEKFRNF